MFQKYQIIIINILLLNFLVSSNIINRRPDWPTRKTKELYDQIDTVRVRADEAKPPRGMTKLDDHDLSQSLSQSLSQKMPYIDDAVHDLIYHDQILGDCPDCWPCTVAGCPSPDDYYFERPNEAKPRLSKLLEALGVLI